MSSGDFPEKKKLNDEYKRPSKDDDDNDDAETPLVDKGKLVAEHDPPKVAEAIQQEDDDDGAIVSALLDLRSTAHPSSATMPPQQQQQQRTLEGAVHRSSGDDVPAAHSAADAAAARDHRSSSVSSHSSVVAMTTRQQGLPAPSAATAAASSNHRPSSVRRPTVVAMPTRQQELPPGRPLLQPPRLPNHDPFGMPTKAISSSPRLQQRQRQASAAAASAAAAAGGVPAVIRVPSHTTRLILAHPDDSTHLNQYHCLLRRQIELFAADQDDFHGIWGEDRFGGLFVGQVGLRCRHCAHRPRWQRGDGSVCFPARLGDVCRAAQTMATNHLCSTCGDIPEEAKTGLLSSAGLAATGPDSVTNEYWIRDCRVKGVKEVSEGLTFTDL